MKVSIIDYGLSNLLSVRRAAEYCGAQVEFVQTPRGRAGRTAADFARRGRF